MKEFELFILKSAYGLDWFSVTKEQAQILPESQFYISYGINIVEAESEPSRCTRFPMHVNEAKIELENLYHSGKC